MSCFIHHSHPTFTDLLFQRVLAKLPMLAEFTS